MYSNHEFFCWLRTSLIWLLWLLLISFLFQEYNKVGSNICMFCILIFYNSFILLNCNVPGRYDTARYSVPRHCNVLLLYTSNSYNCNISIAVEIKQ